MQANCNKQTEVFDFFDVKCVYYNCNLFSYARDNFLSTEWTLLSCISFCIPWDTMMQPWYSTPDYKTLSSFWKLDSRFFKKRDVAFLNSLTSKVGAVLTIQMTCRRRCELGVGRPPRVGDHSTTADLMDGAGDTCDTTLQVDVSSLAPFYTGKLINGVNS